MNKQSLIEKAVIDLCGDFDAPQFPMCYAFTWLDGATGRSLLKKIPEHIEICTREEFNAAADRMRGKPDWSLAPEWGQYLAQDGNGSWWFYDVEVKLGKESFSCPIGGRSQKAGIGKCLGDWRNTLEKRPEQKVETMGEAIKIAMTEAANRMASDLRDLANMQAPAKPWFEAGEFPVIGERVSFFDDSTFASSGQDRHWKNGDELIVLAHVVVNGQMTCVVFNTRHETAQCLVEDCMRPIKTDKEKAIEAAVKVISGEFEGLLAHVFNTPKDAAEKLYDAGLLRLPDQK